MVQNAVQAGSFDPNTDQSARDLDPNVLQRKASVPDSSIWVSASAGTGKTKVLTDRVLRLMLPRDDGQPGSPAHKILCLTFTKAAASEMAIRISETLAKWAVMPLEAPKDKKSLKDELRKLLGRDAKDNEIKAARRLFADVIDVPGGLKIMTIHSFCQSVLGRFPLEAGISPQFTVLEDAQAQSLIHQARETVFKKATDEKTSPLASALENIAQTVNEEQFFALLQDVIRERSQLERLLAKHFDIDGLYNHICSTLNVPANTNHEDMLASACQNEAFTYESLKKAGQVLSESTKKTDQTAGDKILRWLGETPEKRVRSYGEYRSAFLTQDNAPRTRMATKAAEETFPEITDIMAREAGRLIALEEQINAAQSAHLTRDLLRLAHDILEEYESLKETKGTLDFDDLIARTLALLNGSTMQLDTQASASWVHYKLDQGLDHILVDEAQDTNPEQWKIVETLCNEFFSGNEYNATNRSVFIVGDEKQSIYSFQRASPDEFMRMQNDFAQKITQAEKHWDVIPMNISFRSTGSVLKAVDAVFESPLARKGLGELPIEHKAFRRGQAGHVELWPLFESDETDTFDLWNPPKDISESLSGNKKLSNHIADTIQGWLQRGEKLLSSGQPIRPGDIMILVRTRSALVSEIARELKNRNIAVSGLDRMVLNDQLAVQDLLALAEFTLQPHDSLTLACTLKSPFIGLSEEELYDLAVNRGAQSLWDVIRQNNDALYTYLQSLIVMARKDTPYGFFSHILSHVCPGDPISGRRAILGRLGHDALDPVNELLNAAQNYEFQETPSLQDFLHRQKSSETEIKREQESKNDEVRIMTVHGSKGLQAPIVILPDTTSSGASAPSRAEKRLLWPNQSNLDFPLWSPRKAMDFETYREALAHLDEKLDEEYRRLLYVAMTRAEDKLYIGGALGRKKAPENCWYNLIKNGFEALEGVETLEDGSMTIHNPQIHEPDKVKKAEKQAQTEHEPPDWLHEKAPAEETGPTLLQPSHLQDEAVSPLSGQDDYRFLRGNLTHKLLQILPDLPKESRESAARKFLERNADVLNANIRGGILSETLAILGNPAFAPLLGPGSMAEVPITGMIEGKGLVSGQIDRLLITDDEILIIDYKTNRPPPKETGDIPKIYREQMCIYSNVLKQIYPGRTIKAALLWTDGPFLMPLDL